MLKELETKLQYQWFKRNYVRLVDDWLNATDLPISNKIWRMSH